MSGFNWVDILGFVLMVRIIYSAFKQGLVIESFKFFSAVVALVVSAHYYAFLADFMCSKMRCPLNIAEMVSFLLLAQFTYLCGFLFRTVFLRLFKVEASPLINKWGALCFGAARWTVVFGMLLAAMVLSGMTYLSASIGRSFTGKYAVRIVPEGYSFIWNNLVERLSGGVKANNNISNVLSKHEEK